MVHYKSNTTNKNALKSYKMECTMQIWNSARKVNQNWVCTSVCFCNIFLTNPNLDDDEIFHPCTWLDEYRQYKSNFIDWLPCQLERSVNCECSDFVLGYVCHCKCAIVNKFKVQKLFSKKWTLKDYIPFHWIEWDVHLCTQHLPSHPS